MDLNAYWQENKRFLLQVALGLLGFLIVLSIVDGVYGDGISATRLRVSRLKRDLSEATFGAQEESAAEEENDGLSAAVQRLGQAVAFAPRAGFRLEAGAGSASNQYLRALTRVREEILPLANRASVEVEPGLGMPKLSPTRESEIERYLEALDAVDALVRMAIEVRATRVEGIQVRLDPGLTSRIGLGAVERTRVSFSLVGSSRALVTLLARTQRPSDLRPLRIESAEIVRARRAEKDDVRLDLTVVLPRLTDEAPGPAAPEERG